MKFTMKYNWNTMQIYKMYHVSNTCMLVKYNALITSIYNFISSAITNPELSLDISIAFWFVNIDLKLCIQS